MFQIGVGLQGLGGQLDGRRVTPRGLHGLFYDVVSRFDSAEASWLHNHTAPKPYSMAPYYTENDTLAGLRMSAMTETTADLLYSSWQLMQQSQQVLRLGPQKLFVADTVAITCDSFNNLVDCEAVTRIGLSFLSPTAFRQGSCDLTLPIPRNVFRTPQLVWQQFGPGRFLPPGDWLTWCERNVFVAKHNIESVSLKIGKRGELFTGFVGDVWFEANVQANKGNQNRYLSVFHALGRVAELSGIGRKTTMGMGAVKFLPA